MSPIAVSIIHPDFQQVKKAGRPLHLLAVLIIVVNALMYIQQPEANRFYFWSQLIVAADILILIVAGKDLLNDSPKFNLFFRLAEVIVFTTFALLLIWKGDWMGGAVQVLVAGAFWYLFYYEKKSLYAEQIAIQHLGINIPGFPNDRFLSWIDITEVQMNNYQIEIQTRMGKKYSFELSRHLNLDEITVIQNYCGYYLKS
jgi:hypothetical protein